MYDSQLVSDIYRVFAYTLRFSSSIFFYFSKTSVVTNENEDFTRLQPEMKLETVTLALNCFIWSRQRLEKTLEFSCLHLFISLLF